MNKILSILFALFAIVACVAALQQPSIINAHPLECEACHVIVNAMDQWLAENSTVVNIETKLEVACKLLKAAESACDAIVVAGVPQVINWIETNETPELACGPTQLKVCTSN